MKTGRGLADYALAQLGKPYWWGTFGQTASRGLLVAKMNQYPNSYGWNDFEEQFGQKVHDCVGLIKGYRWCDSPDGSPKYVASQDVAVGGLYNQCSKRGDLNTMPDVIGICVFQRNLGHVGVYVGNGKVVEAMGHRQGVVMTDLRARNWSMWGMPDWISYGKANADNAVYLNPYYFYDFKLPLLKIGMKHYMVNAVQKILGISKTGIMDKKTVEAVEEFQKSKGLLADGEVGIDTYKALFGE